MQLLQRFRNLPIDLLGMSTLAGPSFTLEFPLADGRVLVNTHDGRKFIKNGYTYEADGYATYHNASCLDEPKFMRAYQTGITSGHKFGAIDLRWRVHQYCWAATHCMHLEGDFVECGVNTGIFSLSAIEYTNFGASEKTFFLFDTWEGIPMEQYTEAERAVGLDQVHNDSYESNFALAKRNFSPYGNVELVKGIVPDTLTQVTIDKVAYIAIDMNAVAPEIAAAEFFWPKMVSGAIMILDDYGWLHHVNQKIAFDKFAEERGVKILNLPTGQGMLIKP